MIASWMLYALCVTGLLTVAALAAERALGAAGKPMRFVWVASLLLSALWPLGPTIMRLLPEPSRPTVSVMPFTIVVAAPVSAEDFATASRALLIDKALIAAWVLASLILGLRLIYGATIVSRARAAWKRGRVNGVAVKLSENVGPAVVGLRSMDVVLPQWVMSLDESLRAIVLRHEEEHRTARDPYLLFGAAALVALMPWNVALWFQARRLRLAIEMDCDARVLRAHPSAERYGMLILTIAQRRSVAPTLFAPMLTEPATNLERRIIAMRSTRKVARATAVGGAVVTVGVLAFASSLQSAGTAFPRPELPRSVAELTSRMIPVVLPETIPVKKKPAAPLGPNEVLKLDTMYSQSGPATVRGNRAPAYPTMLRMAEVEGAVRVRYTTTSQGTVDENSILILSSTHGLFAQAVRDAVKGWHAAPNSTIETPIVFALANKSGPELADPASVPSGAVIVTATSLASSAAATGGAANAGAAPRVVSENQTYFEYQVEKPVSTQAESLGPRYPAELRAAGVEGQVLAQFVVDTLGMADMATFKVLKSDHDLFTNAVKSALPNLRFAPAEVGDRKVKQLVQMPFEFSLSRQEKKP